MPSDIRPAVADRTITLAALGTDASVRIDRRGGLRPADRAWTVDWAVGAQDGWHLSSEEASVRQALVDATPVVVSALRVPDGAVEQRCWVAVAGGRPVVVVELRNAAPVAVAVAVVLRPVPGGRVGWIDRSGVDVRVEGRPALRFAREPSRAAVGPVDAVLASVAAGIVDPTWPSEGGRSAGGDLAAAFVFPLPHTATLRLVVPLGPDRDVPVLDPGALPGHDTIVSGWRVQTSGAPRFDLPEPEVGTAVDASRRHLLGRAADGRPVDVDGQPLDVSTVAEMAMALDEQGLHVAARGLLVAMLDRQDSSGSFDRAHLAATARVLLALDLDRRLTGDDTLVVDSVEVIASAAHWLHRCHVGSRLRRSSRFFGRGSLVDAGTSDADRRVDDARWTLRALDAAAGSLRAVGQLEAAALVDDHAAALARDMDARGIVGDTDGPHHPSADSDAVARLRDLVAEGAPLWTWPSGRDGDDPARTAAFLRLVRAILVDDSGDGITLLPGPVEPWFGSPLAVHELPTAFGRLSFALRWHGARPALLWDLAPREGPAGPVRLIAPTLDAGWTSLEPRAEALLAEPPHEHRADHDDPGPPNSPTRVASDGGNSFT